MELTPKVIRDTESFEAFRALLQSARLPADDLNFDRHLLVGFYDGVEPVATGGLEVYGSYALLRSLSVKMGIRGQSLGSTITDHLIAEARRRGLKAIYLLTETAHVFFLKKGFKDIDRKDVPAEVRSSSEFTNVCSDTAVCMHFDLSVVPKLKILVLCTGNSCRSQIAEGYLRYLGKDKLEVYSAGIEAHGVNPRAIAIMKEDGIDISKHSSNTVDEYAHMSFDYVITVCDNAKERCPYFPAQVKMFHHDFPDPAKAQGSEAEVEQTFRDVRNMIRDYCARFIYDHVH
jgi:arsenate reductase (thioredoxin)